MNSVGFETQLKNITFFLCKICEVYSPAEYKMKKKKIEADGRIILKYSRTTDV
jgi:hypothetical protein